MLNFRFALLALLLTACSCVRAQIEFGIKAGITTASLEGEEFDLTRSGRQDLQFALEDADYGYQFGVMLRLPLSDRFALVPEVTFNSNKATYRLDDPLAMAGDVLEFEDNYRDINVPLLGSWKIAFLRFQAGPVGHFNVSSVSDLRDADGRERAFDTFTLGYALGGAIDIGPLVIDVRYDGNFSKYGDEFTVAGETLSVDQSQRRWVGSVAYLF